MMNFEFKCPQCGQMVIADEAYRGQVAECPHCGKGIVIPRAKVPVPPVVSKEELVDGLKTQNLRDKKGMKWQQGRNSELGQQSVSETVLISNEPVAATQTLLGWWKGFGVLQKLIVLLWAGIVLDAISCILGFFDVREYYELGRFANFIFCLLIDLLMGVWLVISISHRKSWARKMYIILGLLALVFIVWNFNESISANALKALIDLLSLGISIFCLVMCFSKDIRKEFIQDAMLKGPKAIINRYQCVAYILVLITIFVVGVLVGVRHDGSDAWLSDCTEAAALGSESARNDLIEKLTGEYIAELPDGSQEDEVQIAILKKRAKREIDDLIKSNSKYSKSRQDASGTSRNGLVDFLLSKGIAKILVAIFVACFSMLGLKFARIPSVVSVLTIVIGSIVFVSIRYKYNRESVPEQSNYTESTEHDSEDVEAHPTSTENSIPIPVIKNSAGEYDWQSMCQKEWPKSFSEIQKAFSVFGGFQLAQSPVEGFEISRVYDRIDYQLIQKGVPLQKKYRYFQNADLEFYHGALVRFTLTAHFAKKYSKASIDSEFTAFQNDVVENLKCLNKPELGIEFGGGERHDFEEVAMRNWFGVEYVLSRSPSIHNITGKIFVICGLKQDDNGYDLMLSVEHSHGDGLRKFIEMVLEKEAYEAGEKLEGFDKNQQSSDDSTKEHQHRNRTTESVGRKAEVAETRSVRTESPVPPPTISGPNGTDSSPNRTVEVTDFQSPTSVRQPAERKTEDGEASSMQNETPIPVSTGKGSPSKPTEESIDSQQKAVAPPNPHFEAARKHDWQSMCQKEWGKAFVAIQEALSIYGGFRLAQPPIDGVEFETEDIQKDVPLIKQYRYFKKADMEFFNGALVGFTLKAHFAKSYSKASVEREYKAFQDDVVKNLKRLKRPELEIEDVGTSTYLAYGQSRNPSAHEILGRIRISCDLRQDDDGYDLTLSVDAQVGMKGRRPRFARECK